MLFAYKCQVKICKLIIRVVISYLNTKKSAQSRRLLADHLVLTINNAAAESTFQMSGTDYISNTTATRTFACAVTPFFDISHKFNFG